MSTDIKVCAVPAKHAFGLVLEFERRLFADAVRSGEEPNTLRVSMTGVSIRFEVNGDVVALLNYDDLPASGGAGVFVGGDLNEVAVEWLRIETL